MNYEDFHYKVGTEMTKTPRNQRLKDAAAVAAHYGEPSVLARDKIMMRLDKYARQFIACAPAMLLVQNRWLIRININVLQTDHSKARG